MSGVLSGILCLGIFAAAPAAAFPVPVDGGNSHCTYPNTGWQGWYANYTYVGSLEWQICLLKDNSGRKAKIQLTSPVDDEHFDHWTATVYLDLYACGPKGDAVLREHTRYDTGSPATQNREDAISQAGGRYYFQPIKTDYTTAPSSTYGFSIVLTVYQGSVLPDAVLSRSLNMSKDGPQGTYFFGTNCWTTP